VDCYFHSNVPSIARCNDCAKPLCATCRGETGTCPSCLLAQRIDAASASRERLPGQVPVRQRPAHVATMDEPVESRALVALGYPIWPLALISLFDRKQSMYLRRQSLQALGFNLGMFGLFGLFSLISMIPFLGLSAAIALPFFVPIFLVCSVVYGFKAFHGDDVRIPIISDWLDERLPQS